MPLIPMIAAILVALTGAVSGTAVISENAVPGDTLYPVKTGLNEQVRDLLAIGDEAQAEWEASKAERRLEEAEELSLRGDKDSLAKVEENFEKHLKKAKEIRVKLEEKEKFNEAVDLQSRLESSLAAHERIFDKIRFNADTEEKQIEITDIIKKLQAKIKTMRQEGVGLEEKEYRAGDVLEASEGKLKAVENKLEEIEKLVEKRSEELSEDILKTATDKIAVIKRNIVVGKQKVEDKDYQAGFQLYQQAIRELQEVNKIIATMDKLEVEKKIRERIEKREQNRKENIQNEDDNENAEGVDDNEVEEELKNEEDSENMVQFEGGAVEFETAN